MYDPLMYESDDRLGDEYGAYLDEICKCDLENEGCECITFERWLQEKIDEYEESFIA